MNGFVHILETAFVVSGAMTAWMHVADKYPRRKGLQVAALAAGAIGTGILVHTMRYLAGV